MEPLATLPESVSAMDEMPSPTGAFTRFAQSCREATDRIERKLRG
jgi:hypothetical protein